MMTEINDRLLKQAEVAEITGMSSAWLEMSRFKGTGIRFCKLGRAIRYKYSDVMEFINDHMVGTGI